MFLNLSTFATLFLVLGPYLLPKGLLVLVLIFSKVYYVPGPYKGGPYKMIMRVCDETCHICMY